MQLESLFKSVNVAKIWIKNRKCIKFHMQIYVVYNTCTQDNTYFSAVSVQWRYILQLSPIAISCRRLYQILLFWRSQLRFLSNINGSRLFWHFVWSCQISIFVLIFHFYHCSWTYSEFYGQIFKQFQINLIILRWRVSWSNKIDFEPQDDLKLQIEKQHEYIHIFSTTSIKIITKRVSLH